MKYVLITPVYNEERYVADTIKSVVAQTMTPSVWLLVDDGSTDGTAAIIRKAAGCHAWIRYWHRCKTPGQTYYGSNVEAILEGVAQLKEQEYDYLGIVDGDISLPRNYYELLISRMEADAAIGISSGVYVDRIAEGVFRKALSEPQSTPKGLMMFRRRCFEEIGGFIPMKYGYEDACAGYLARMKAWKTRSFSDIVAVHNKPAGTGHATSLLKIRFRLGIGEYYCGSHPLFAILKSLRRCVKEAPLLIGGLARLAGYVYAAARGERRQVSDALVRYLRKEQLSRIFAGRRR
jgi:glycosyltransferase involved in cell wall biosynthesis